MTIQAYPSKALPNQINIKNKKKRIIIYYCSLTTFLLKGCLIDHYKNIVGDEACHKCPGGKTNNTMHTKGECKKDYYIGHNESGRPCYGMYL
jgi:hypothetical protein